jgi:hypothetical protein
MVWEPSPLADHEHCSPVVPWPTPRLISAPWSRRTWRCDAIARAVEAAPLSRRGLILGAGAAAAAGAVSTLATGPVAHAANRPVGDGDVYLVDFGDGSAKRFKEAALVEEALRTPGGQWGQERLTAMFITHPGETPPEIPLENPVPGTVDMTNYLYQAFALDLNDRMRDSRKPSLRTSFDVHDIELPAGVGFHPNDNHHPEMEPFLVHEDDKVKVTATLVDHYPLAPAFGFRFDSADGSVVFSGDTAPSQNLVRLAKGADILVHEVITEEWVDILFPPPRTPVQEALRNHLLTAHTLPEDAGRIATEAGVSTLVFSHIVPGNAEDKDLMVARRTFSGRIVSGHDLMQFGVGTPR